MNITENKAYIDSLVDIMGIHKRQCLAELFITEQDLYEMNWDQFQCAKANVIEWLNDFYGVRK